MATTFRGSAIYLVLFFCGAGLVSSQEAATSNLSSSGWTINADSTNSEISVSHQLLGVVIQHLRLNVRDAQGLHPLHAWQTVKSDRLDRIVIKSSNPTTGWQIEVTANVLKISTTAEDGMVTGDLPASSERMLARLIDPEGIPVNWEGTKEVQVGYGGSLTRNPSTLPRKNTDAMYFRLGKVESAVFHDQFDRPSDTGIRFPETSRLHRDVNDPNILKLEMPVPENAIVRLMPDYYTKTLGMPYYVPFNDSVFTTAPMVWSSWTSYYENVREADIVSNTDWIANKLLPYGFQYVELDDGYDRGKNKEHYWIDNWDKTRFPHGAKWLTDYVKSKGLLPGLWLVPNAYAGAVTTHPDWYVRDKSDKLILDYNTPTLDSTNPEVLNFLRTMFTKLDDMGFEYYKFDGEHAFSKYVPLVDHSKLHDPNADLLANFRERLSIIREVIGPKRFVESCPAGTPLNSVGYVDSYFNGDDLYASWQGMYPLFSSINANAFFNHVTSYLMPGEGLELGLPMTVEEAKKKRLPVVLETTKLREDPLAGFGVNDAEARTLVTYVALTGVAYPLASVMPELPEQRVQLLQKTLPTLPIYPVDLFSRGTEAKWDTFRFTQPDFYIHNFPEVLDLKVNATAGQYDLVGLTNWRSSVTTRNLDFKEKLGLAADASYVVFDFWRQEFVGVHKKTLSLDIEPHDTRVLSIHPLEDHPQLLALSRHISGTYSLRELSWDSSQLALTGVSDVVPGDPYSVWLYVPAGYTMDQLHVTNGNQEIPFIKEWNGPALKLTFAATAGPARWTVEFRK